MVKNIKSWRTYKINFLIKLKKLKNIFNNVSIIFLIFFKFVLSYNINKLILSYVAVVEKVLTKFKKDKCTAKGVALGSTLRMYIEKLF